MIGWFLIILSAVGMGRIAESEGRSGVLWGLGTGVACYLGALVIPIFSWLGIGIGLLLSFVTMTVVKMVEQR
jgi:hypothetical protein